MERYGNGYGILGPKKNTLSGLWQGPLGASSKSSSFVADSVAIVEVLADSSSWHGWWISWYGEGVFIYINKINYLCLIVDACHDELVG